ncbi:MAG: hypothetical protein FJY75_04995 [Candidatus Eisenbacteria bacterium]|uniref:FlgD/Vpr Ig-like domain-containing protein n=1 Tax=Eiseniibacteriota bacterium TaxID=2212470 RepID=A0A937XB90_UNCEI|nr:hypothetical protein [Candidatus Eisenbacteria bacterium]
MTVDLSGFAGPAQLRWAFGSDGAVTREGWYIDDVRILLDTASAAPHETAARVLRPRLLAAGPSPAPVGGAARGQEAASIAIRFALPREARVDVDLYDAAGRHVRALGGEVLGAGVRSLPWDGRDAAGRLVPAGSYFYRFAADGEALHGRVAVVR